MGLKPKHFTKENAREMQALGVEKRKENEIQKQIVTSKVIEKLLEPIHEGSSKTRLEWLVEKALSNIKDDVDLKDLKDLKDLAEEKTTTSNINLNAPRKDAKDLLERLKDGGRL